MSSHAACQLVVDINHQLLRARPLRDCKWMRRSGAAQSSQLWLSSFAVLLTQFKLQIPGFNSATSDRGQAGVKLNPSRLNTFDNYSSNARQTPSRTTLQVPSSISTSSKSDSTSDFHHIGHAYSDFDPPSRSPLTRILVLNSLPARRPTAPALASRPSLDFKVTPDGVQFDWSPRYHGYNVDTATTHLPASIGNPVLVFAGGTIAKTGCDVNGWDEFWLECLNYRCCSSVGASLTPRMNNSRRGLVLEEALSKQVGKWIGGAIGRDFGFQLPECMPQVLECLSKFSGFCGLHIFFNDALRLKTDCPVEFLGRLSSKFTGKVLQLQFKPQRCAALSSSSFLTRSGGHRRIALSFVRHFGGSPRRSIIFTDLLFIRCISSCVVFEAAEVQRHNVVPRDKDYFCGFGSRDTETMLVWFEVFFNFCFKIELGRRPQFPLEILELWPTTQQQDDVDVCEYQHGCGHGPTGFDWAGSRFVTETLQTRTDLRAAHDAQPSPQLPPCPGSSNAPTPSASASATKTLLAAKQAGACSCGEQSDEAKSEGSGCWLGVTVREPERGRLEIHTPLQLDLSPSHKPPTGPKLAK
ncbi:hypothetical protein C8R46DRAFT_1046149 [Mycena filopes]|nr:hypothetical protein C8R46DRAFT_1046149 [Mycena filopes]